MITLKTENGKYIVTIHGNKCVFDSLADAHGFIYVRKCIGI